MEDVEELINKTNVLISNEETQQSMLQIRKIKKNNCKIFYYLFRFILLIYIYNIISFVYIRTFSAIKSTLAIGGKSVFAICYN